MKNLIILTLTIIFSNASLSLAGQFKSRWGVVIGVSPGKRHIKLLRTIYKGCM
jgi:hypothetical protein